MGLNVDTTSAEAIDAYYAAIGGAFGSHNMSQAARGVASNASILNDAYSDITRALGRVQGGGDATENQQAVEDSLAQYNAVLGTAGDFYEQSDFDAYDSFLATAQDLYGTTFGYESAQGTVISSADSQGAAIEEAASGVSTGDFAAPVTSAQAVDEATAAQPAATTDTETATEVPTSEATLISVQNIETGAVSEISAGSALIGDVYMPVDSSGNEISVQDALSAAQAVETTTTATTEERAAEGEILTAADLYAYAIADGGKTDLTNDATWMSQDQSIREAAWAMVTAYNDQRGIDSTTGEATYIEYTIVSGDNLTRIAERYGTTVSAILDLNPQITNPNLIYAGASLNIPNTGTDLGVTGDETPEISEIDIANAAAETASTLTSAAYEAYDESLSDEAQEMTLRELLESYLTSSAFGYDFYDSSTITGTDGSTVEIGSSMEMYQSMLDSENITNYQNDLIDVQTQLAEMEQMELELASDIRAEVSGEASESYIQAKVMERLEDLYPQKLYLQRQEAILISALESEQTNIANMMQYYMYDATTAQNAEAQQYDRMWDMLNYLDTQEATTLQNELNVLSVIRDMPAGRYVSIGGVTYEGMASNDNINVVTTTDANNHSIIYGIDRTTGEVVYQTDLGLNYSAPSGGSGDSALDIFQENIEFEFLSNFYNSDGSMREGYETNPETGMPQLEDTGFTKWIDDTLLGWI